jgi:hypothetical protein
MPHTCKEPGCKNDVFASHYCKYHQFRRAMRGGDKYQAKPKKVKQAKLPLESKTRKREHKLYSAQIKIFWDESVENKTDFCFFCGEHMDKRDNVHHLKGRIGDYYLDKEFWVNCHNDCHAYKYHSLDAEHLKQLPWFEKFMARLKSKSLDAYNKELRRHDKVQPLNPKLFENDDELFD